MTVTALLALVFAQDSTVDIEVGTWFPALSGNLQFKEPPRTSSRLDLHRNLGVDDIPVSPRLGATLSVGRNRFGVRYQFAQFEGTKLFDQTKVHKGDLYPAGEENATEIVLQEIFADYSRVLAESESFELAAGVTARFVTFDLEIQGPSNPDNDETIGAFLPELTLRVAGRIAPDLSFRAFLAVGAMDLLDVFGHSLTADASVHWSLSPSVSIGGGYRLEFLHLNVVRPLTAEKHDSIFFLGGPYLAVDVRF